MKPKPQTVVEWIIHVLGRNTMMAGDIEAALLKVKDSGRHQFNKAKNLRGYISSVLSSAVDQKGQKIFHAVERGRYRVLTEAEREARKQAGVAADQAAVQWYLDLSEEDAAHCDRLQALSRTKFEKILSALEAIEAAS